MTVYILRKKWYDTAGCFNMKKWLRTVLLLVFTGIFLYSGWMLLDYFLASHKQKSQFNDLAHIVQQHSSETTLPPETLPTDDSQPESTLPTEPSILPEYAVIFDMNPDVVGWMKIDGTDINYPVMQTPGRTDYYLHRDFYGNYSGHGCLYAQEDCDVATPSDNVIVYGHHMKDGSMFAGLLDYRKKAFYTEHPVIQFDSLTRHRRYEIFAVFLTTASEGQGFPYHQFINAQTEEKFDDFASQCKALSLYDTGITPVYGDKLLTLSTCEYSQENGRFVVVARLVD